MRMKGKGDEGSSLVIVLAVFGGLLLMVTALLPFASTNIVNSANFKSHVDDSYQVDGSLKLAAASVRSVPASDPAGACKDYTTPQPLNGLTVACYTTGGSSFSTSGGSVPGITPSLVGTSGTPVKLFPGDVRTVSKSVVADGLYRPATSMSGKNGCNFEAKRNTKTNTAINFPTPTAPGVAQQANFTPADVGGTINVWENGSCVNGVGNGNGNNTTYIIAAVLSPTSIKLTQMFGGTGQMNTLKNYQWEVPAPTPVTVSGSAVYDSSTCPSDFFEINAGPAQTSVVGGTFTFNETITIKTGATPAPDPNTTYACRVDFLQDGALRTGFTQMNYIKVITETRVYFTATDSSGDVVGKASAVYSNNVSPRTFELRSWELL